MARVHDESLRYVLSEQAIGTLATKVPISESDIFDTISTADLSSDYVNLSYFVHSPSPVVFSHFEDFNLLFQDSAGEVDDLYYPIIQMHLSSDGTCPLSKYNYALLSKNTRKLVNGPLPKQNGVRSTKQVARKASRELFVKKFSCKSPVYHNCRIYANDGRLLCYCDQKKLEWYLNRDLATLVEDDPPAIMLLFEPKGRPEDEDNDFYIQSKKNICVGCGEGDHYLRYRIIPSCYRMHFPEHLKSHRSHDIVLLCVDCHEIAHAAAEKHKRQVAAEFGIPLYICKVVDSSQAKKYGESSSDGNLEDVGVSPLQLRAAAMALLRHGPRMPAKRCEELTQIVKKYYGGRQITEEDLEKALLVGMSPHEKRRYEKKRGLTFRLTTTAEVIDGSDSNRDETCCKQDNGDDVLTTNNEVTSHSLYSSYEANGEFTSATVKELEIDGSKSPEAESINLPDSDVLLESQNTMNGTTDLVHSNHDQNVESKQDSKYSLLGHGPHGKQVVGYLLEEYGEDGIRQFCQRWRQVFVEAVHPRFLPAGWDVMHSGRRDFGEFSVYKHAKKVSDANAAEYSGAMI